MRTTVLLASVALAANAFAEEPWPELSAPAAATAAASKDVAVVIGIEKYAAVPHVPGAQRNADDWYAWFLKGRGLAPTRVKLLRDNEATREGILEATAWAASEVQKEGRAWLVFVGHGAPAKDGSDGVLVGWDAQQTAQSLYARSVSCTELVAAFAKAKGPPPVLVLDACFSGKSADGREIIRGLQPLIALKAAKATAKAVVLTAAKGDQFAGPLPGDARPAFSYLVLGALRGWGDADHDGKVTAAEAATYAEQALTMLVTDRKQTPTVEGAGAEVLAQGAEAGPDLTARKLARAKAAAEIPDGFRWECANLPATFEASAGKLGAGNGGSGVYWDATPLVGDFDGDGKADIAQFNQRWGSMPVCYSRDSGFVCKNLPTTYGGGLGAGNGGSGTYLFGLPLAGDFDGDGKSDMFEFHSAWASIPTCTSVDKGWSCKNAAATYASGMGAGNSGSGIYSGATPFVADFNGDRRADVLMFASYWGSIPVCQSTESGWSCMNLPATYAGGIGPGNGGSGIYSNGTPLVGDVDGDGRADVAQYDGSWGSIPVCLSTGTGWSCRNSAATYAGGLGAGNSGTGIHWGGTPALADVNGDGRADLVQFNERWWSVPVCLSQAAGWSCKNLEAAYKRGVGAGNAGRGIYLTGIPLYGRFADARRYSLALYNNSWWTIPVCLWGADAWSCGNVEATYTKGVGAGNNGRGIYQPGRPLVGDFDGDGRDDIAQFDYGWGSIPVCFARGSRM